MDAKFYRNRLRDLDFVGGVEFWPIPQECYVAVRLSLLELTFRCDIPNANKMSELKCKNRAIVSPILFEDGAFRLVYDSHTTVCKHIQGVPKY